MNSNPDTSAHAAIYALAFLVAEHSSINAIEGLVGALAAVAVAAHKSGDQAELVEWLQGELAHAIEHHSMSSKAQPGAAN